jgi:hypothetical protein
LGKGGPGDASSVIRNAIDEGCMERHASFLKQYERDTLPQRGAMLIYKKLKLFPNNWHKQHHWVAQRCQMAQNTTSN